MSKIGLGALAVSRLKNHYRNNLRRLHRKLFFDKSDQGSGFFDAYSRFYETSVIGPRDRLNKRDRALSETNRELIQGKSVWDMASHDGRWSLATHKAGARQVLGIEAREHLVKYSRDNISAYHMPEDKVE